MNWYNHNWVDSKKNAEKKKYYVIIAFKSNYSTADTEKVDAISIACIYHIII